jgi:type IV secretory pathway VirB9-like protein
MCAMRWTGPRATALMAAMLTAQGVISEAAAQTGVREVAAPERGVIPLQTRLRYTTMVVLPDGEEILDILCGDRDFWVISATHNIAHVKPAKAGAETNLNLVTASGTIYSFLLSEKSSPPDLKVYVQGEPRAATGKPKVLLGSAS